MGKAAVYRIVQAAPKHGNRLAYNLRASTGTTTESHMAVILAPAALARVQRYLAESPEAIGLRFGVTRTGCSGWQHFADLAKDEREGDTVFEQEGVRIYVDATSLALVDGTEIDLVKQRLGEQFVFRNPNASAECGCGESFTTDADKAA